MILSIRGGLTLGVPAPLRIKAWKTGFYTYFLFVNIGFGMYLTISRDTIHSLLGYDYSFMSLVVAAENIPLLFSVIGGGLGDVIGRRHLVLVGSVSAIPLLLIPFLPLNLLPLMASLYVLFWSLAQPSITGALLHATSSSGVQYSIYAVFGTIGWGIGGPLAGVLIRIYGGTASWVTASIITLTGFLVAYLLFPPQATGGSASPSDLLRALRLVYPYFLANVLAMSGFLLFYGNYSLVLRGRISDPGLYGLIYTFIPSIIGIITRPLIGVASERIEPLRIALAGILTYIVVTTGLYYSSGLLMVILWAVPVYPLVDQGFMLTYSRRLPSSLQAFASGLWGTAFSMGGILVLLAGVSPTSSSLTWIYCSSEILLISSASLLIPLLLNRRNRLSM